MERRASRAARADRCCRGIVYVAPTRRPGRSRSPRVVAPWRLERPKTSVGVLDAAVERITINRGVRGRSFVGNRPRTASSSSGGPPCAQPQPPAGLTNRLATHRWRGGVDPDRRPGSQCGRVWSSSCPRTALVRCTRRPPAERSRRAESASRLESASGEERHFPDALAAGSVRVRGRGTRHRIAIGGGRQDRHFPDAPRVCQTPRLRTPESGIASRPSAQVAKIGASETLSAASGYALPDGRSRTGHRAPATGASRMA